MTTKPRNELTLKDRLSRLTFQQAVRLLGPEGARLIRAGGAASIDIESQIRLTHDRFSLRLPGFDANDGSARVTITLADHARRRLEWSCTACAMACEHAGAAFSLILEEKTVLGLARPPERRTPIESLSEDELIEEALEQRRERARDERMTVKSLDPSRPWSDYTIRSAESGKTYRVALRGEQLGQSYCTCPDFRTNTLGTCKHILHALAKVKKRHGARAMRRSYRRKSISVHLQYGREIELRWGLPNKTAPDIAAIVGRGTRPITSLPRLMSKLRRLEALGYEVLVYPDAEEYIQRKLLLERIELRAREIRKNPKRHPLRKELLKSELLPYQLDGIAFAAGVGRAILADDMGLGKTIQGIGVAELLAREAGISRVLIVCPASVKGQWQGEIRRFSRRSCQCVVGTASARAEQYGGDDFFTICNYEQVLRDILSIEQVPWSLIILDEGQRIKNWEAKTSRIIKGLRSTFALVLSGTPLENRLDELYSVVQFIDDRRLGPAFRFFNRHRVTDDRGKVLGYKNLTELRKRLKPILLRRTREEVLGELPSRSTKIVRIAATEEQLELHRAHMSTVSMIVHKPFLTEMDLLRLQKALLMCRMAANSTFLVDKQEPGYSSKVDELRGLLAQLSGEKGRKIVVFSEWTTMLDLIEPILDRLKIRFVRLDGSVPQKKRQALVHEFQKDSECCVFLTSNAGSTGLNLQAANTVINVDLPWNPAVLEQRIGRVHRMGQKRPVQVFVLVTTETIEENLLRTLSAKHELALAALDPSSDVDEVDLVGGLEELKRRLEILLGKKPEASLDESQKRRSEEESIRLSRKASFERAGGRLVSAAFEFLTEIVPEAAESEGASAMSRELRERFSECIERDESGNARLTVTLPSEETIDRLVGSLARILAAKETEART